MSTHVNSGKDPYVEKVESLIKEFAGNDISIGEHTSIQYDLGIEGDDAGDLMEEYSRRFSVNLDGFIFEKYFDYEGGFNPVVYLSSLLKREKNKTRKVSLTVAMLVDGCKRGRWNDSEN